MTIYIVMKCDILRISTIKQIINKIKHVYDTKNELRKIKQNSIKQ